MRTASLRTIKQGGLKETERGRLSEAATAMVTQESLVLSSSSSSSRHWKEEMGPARSVRD